MKIVLGVIAAFIAEALLQLLPVGAIAQLTGTPLPLQTVLRRTSSFTLAWLLFAPLAIGLALRYPLFGARKWRNAVLVTIGVVLLATLRALVGGHVERKFLQYPVSARAIRLHLTLVTGAHLQFLAVMIGATNLVRARGELLRRQAQILEADTQLARMEMNELRAHLQPGFLFLTLEGIARVVPHDPIAADGMIVTLSDLLRRSLASATREVTLGESLDQLDRYVALHAAASGKPTALHLAVDADLLAARLPFGVVQPLVEAAIVHTFVRGGGRIRLTASQRNARLYVDVTSAAAFAGVGAAGPLEALRAQLERLFGNGFALEARHDARSFHATLDMPFARL